MKAYRWGALWLLLGVLAEPAAAASQLRLDAVLGDGAAEGFARADLPRRFHFPRDHGPHPAFRSEWWYLTANLRDASGAELGVQLTIFRQALAPEPVLENGWATNQLYLAHVAVTDVGGGRHLHAERIARGHPRLAGARAEPFRVRVDGWSLHAADGALNDLRLVARTDEFALELDFDAAKPVVLQGDRGLSAKGPDQASYYYSIPRLATRGTVRIGARSHAVTGGAWLDREWSTSVLSGAQQGWDWFALQLDSGQELMAFQLRREDGTRDPFDQGLWVAEDGAARHLSREQFRLRARRYWTDEHGVAWPVAWTLEVDLPDGPRAFAIEAALDDQRMDTLLTYWEGLVRVRDEETGTRVGTGYMELTGYE